MCRWVFLAALLSAAVVGAQPSAETRYRDPKGRFTFDYPAAFGMAGAGTNDKARIHDPGFVVFRDVKL